MGRGNADSKDVVMVVTPQLSVLIATHNRAETLRDTLEALTLVDRGDDVVEYVVVDNNSTDQTEDVVQSFIGRLPIQYLFEPQPGKNCALNHALDRVPLGDLVVFIDDDISPQMDWLEAIQSASDRWPDVCVFGGKIDIHWPDVTIPTWAKNPRIQPFAFGRHERKEREELYPTNMYPFGGNYWVRRRVFENNRRFNESVGPRPIDRIMGSEATFLRRLQDDGFQMVYSADAVVAHRIQPELLLARSVRRRAYRQGRGTTYWRGPALSRFLRWNRAVWYPACLCAIAVLAVLAALSRLSISPFARVERSVWAIRHLAHCVESLRVGASPKKE